MPNNAIAGIAYVKIDGTQYKMTGDWTYQMADVQRETMVGTDSVHGYKETPLAPYIEGSIRDLPSIDLKDLHNQVRDNTITLELISGKVVTLRNAWSVTAPAANTGDGSVPMRFEGLSGEEVTNAS